MNILKLIKHYGFIGSIRRALLKFLRLETQKESVDSLYFYLNNYLIDATLLPPAKDPELRIMQKCDAALLQILDKICKKHNLIYWLDFGTLLGAQRHKGFIPWDDDMDISMLREDYNKLIPILKEELKDENFDIEESNGRIGFGYKHKMTGIWCDIFPVDIYKASETFENSVKNLKDKIGKYRSFYDKYTKKRDYTEIVAQRASFIKDEDNASYSIIYHGREFNHIHPNAFYLEDEIFPLSTIEFEGYNFYVPSQTHEYLVKIFGRNYLQVPRGGILHHSEGRGPLSTWASKNNIDMNFVYNYLKNLQLMDIV